MASQEPIAIIGAACRLPGEVSSLGTLWDMIKHAKTGHGKVPRERWDADVWHHPDPNRKGGISVRHGYFLQQDIAHFDAPFFSTTAKEAAAMDPMKRLLLEVSYESIENAGIPVENLMNSRTGCYVGCMTNDYEILSLHDIHDIGHNAASATSEAMIANRVSWFYGLRGPSLTIDTACSSSLYALHLACQSLSLKETEMSLVAGVNLILIPNTMHQLSAMHMLSPEGISHTFDSRANGYGRGEGIGCLVLKRFTDAIRDGDTIRAVIRGTGANADGKTPSITQPSSLAQADLITSTYQAAGLPQYSTTYFESHGTGTPVGDPIELQAIASTLGASRVGLGPLYVGSIKPSVGHTEGCSGLAGVFKALVCLEKGMLVPTYGVETVNPKLKLEKWNLALPDKTMKWPAPGLRRISINSFGFGGANAHVILDDAYHYMARHPHLGNHSTTVHDDEDGLKFGIGTGPTTPVKKTPGNRDAKRLFVFSTKDQAGIQRIAATYSNELTKSGREKIDEPSYFENLAYTLALRRSRFDFRSFVVASTIEELVKGLEKGLPKIKRSSRHDNNVAFVFTGQGAQWAAMGRELQQHVVFKGSMEASQRFLDELGCKWDVFEELTKTAGSNINFPEYSQTLCTVLQVATVDLLRCWKITPKATVGHSSGEIAAAYAAGYITHADAINIAYTRGLSSATVSRNGAMLAVGLSSTKALEYLAKVPHESAVIACINSPSSVTLSGDVNAIDTLEALISGDGRFARKLKVKTAYHSPHMREVAEGYLERIGDISPITNPESNTVMFSSLTGKQVDPRELNASYWVNNMCSPVEFAAAVSSLLNHTTHSISGRGKESPMRWGALVEIGPHAALQGPVQQIITASSSKAAKDAMYMGVILRGKDAMETALTVAGQLWALGCDVDLATVNEHNISSPWGRPKALTDLPPYPWNHGKSYWHESYSMQSNRFPTGPRTDLLGVPEDLQNNMEPRWRNHLRISENPWIEDHQITGTILYPAAGMLVMALEGALQTADPAKKVHGFRFREVGFERGLVVPSGDETAVETRLSLFPHKSVPGQFQFTIYSTVTGTSWTKHCSGTVAIEYTATDVSEVEDSNVDTSWVRHSEIYEQLTSSDAAEKIDVDTFYDNLETIGMQYGPLFRNVVSLTAVPSQKAAHAIILIPDTKSTMPANFEYPHLMHPATMDAIFHLLLAAFNDGRPIEQAAVPYSIEDMFVAANQPHGIGACFYGYGKLVVKNGGGRETIGDLIVSDETWSAPKLMVKGFALRQVASADDSSGSASRTANVVRKCARIKWSEDVDFISTSEDVARLCDAEGNKRESAQDQLKLWLDRLVHKKAVQEVLLVADRELSPLSSILRHIWGRTGRRPGFGKVTVTAANADGLDFLRSLFPSSPEWTFELWDINSDEDPPITKTPYDIVLTADRDGVPSKLHKHIAPSGHIVVLQDYGSSTNVSQSLAAVGFLQQITIADETSSLLIASTPALTYPNPPSEVYILLPDSASPQVSMLSITLAATLSSSTITVHSTTLSSMITPDLTGKYVISLLEVDTPFICSWNGPQFASFKKLVSSAKHLLWLTRGGLLQSWSGGVDFAPAQGLIRVLRNEYSLVTLPHLDFSAEFDPTSHKGAELIADVWRSSLIDGAEMEYAELGGAIYIPRAVEDAGFDGELQLANNSAKPVRSALRANGKALKMASSAEEVELLWIEDDDSEKPLDSREVEVEVEYMGLSPRNAENNESVSRGFSHEAVGIVSRRGENVRSVVVGQRVAVFGNQAFKTHIRQDESLVAAVPAKVPPHEAAALPNVFITAQYALLQIAGLVRGQTALIQSAASALGQAAIQISQLVGAKLFCLVGSKNEKDILVERYGIPPTCIFDSALQTFATAIGEATDGRGVDIIFNSQCTPAVLPSIATLADFGHFLDLTCDASLSLPSSKRNASLTRIDMDHVVGRMPEVIKMLFQRTFDFFCRSGRTLPITPTTVYSVTDMEKAFDALKRQPHEKIVLSLDKHDTVLTLPPPPPKLMLDSDATYVLAGGLGALGLNIADMMVEHGAGHLVFLSRSGGSKNEKDLESFRGRGVRAEAFKCDVNDFKSVAEVFSQLKRNGKAIKGVIQCAMVLEDTIFDNMTHEKWTRAISPKTHGSRNLLSNLTPAYFPFFILLSSITGIIGNTAQANYASGNTFEDALAHYAHAHLSIPATSVDVGLVVDSSHFTSAGGFGDLESYLHKYQHGWVGLQTTLDELRVVLKAIMRGATADGAAIPPQIILGLGDTLTREDGTTEFQRDRKFDLRVVATGGGDAGEDGKKVSVGEMLAQAASLAEASTAVEESMKTQIAAAIGVPVEEVDAMNPLFDFGVDSLKAVEIRNKALREMRSDISVFELLSATPLSEIAMKIAVRSKLVKAEVAKSEE